MIPDPFVNDISQLLPSRGQPIKVDLDSLDVKKIADDKVASTVAAEVVGYFAKQKRWKPVKAQSSKAFGLARYYTDKEAHLPLSASKAIAHALGVYVYVERRTRATNAAILEGEANAKGITVTTDELADRVGLSARTLHYLRNKRGYNVHLASSHILMAMLREEGLLDRFDGTGKLAEFVATPPLKFKAEPEESEKIASSTLVTLRRYRGEPPLSLRTKAYDLVCAYSLVFLPVPLHVLEVLAVALCLVNVRKRIPYAGA